MLNIEVKHHDHKQEEHHHCAYHEATEAVDLALFTSGECTEAQATKFWYDCWDVQVSKGMHKEPDVTKWRKGGRASKAMPNREDTDVWVVKGLEMVLGYLAYRKASDWLMWTLPDDSPAIEVLVRMDLDGVEVMGFIDRIHITPTGELVVRDLKTGRKPDSHLQLGTYAAMLESTFDVRPRWGDYFLGRDCRPTGPVNLDPYTREYLTTEYGKIHQMRKLGLYLVNEGSHCISCGVRDACRLKGQPEVIVDWKDKLPEYE